MKSILFAGAMALGLFATTTASHAALPPAAYDGPIGARIAAQWNNMVGSVKADTYVAPWSTLVPGQYINPTTGAVEGAPSCPAGPRQKWGKPFC